MTIVVSILCTDGVVVAADSMVTSVMGGTSLGHHKGRKIYTTEDTICAFAGDMGLGARFAAKAQCMFKGGIQASVGPLDRALKLSEKLTQKFQATCATGMGKSSTVDAALAFRHDGKARCSIFYDLQPQILDEIRFYASLGTGALSTDSFLRFLTDVYCQNEPPSVNKARFLACWAVQHAIETAPGGVSGPIRMAVFEKKSSSDTLKAEELSKKDVEEHQQNIESTTDRMLEWFQDTGAGRIEAAPPPERRKKERR